MTSLTKDYRSAFCFCNHLHWKLALSVVGCQFRVYGVYHSKKLGYRRQRKISAMETQLKGLRNGAPDVPDLKNSSTIGGGVGDTFGEDTATEDQTLTPWARIVAR